VCIPRRSSGFLRIRIASWICVGQGGSDIVRVDITGGIQYRRREMALSRYRLLRRLSWRRLLSRLFYQPQSGATGKFSGRISLLVQVIGREKKSTERIQAPGRVWDMPRTAPGVHYVCTLVPTREKMKSWWAAIAGSVNRRKLLR
jgi:hypothetical protein